VKLTNPNVRYFGKLAPLTGVTEVLSQVTGYSKTFEVGSPHPIRGKITILRVTRDRAERQRGLSEAARSRSGNHPDQAPFYGFMGNVRALIPTFPQELMVFLTYSGCWKERSLVC
jgi:hypothetical protein